MPRKTQPHRLNDVEGSSSIPPLPSNASVIKRWKFRRNLVIFVAHRGGLSQPVLADVFDMPKSTVAAIIKGFSKYK
jgi:hypothetical protein